MLQTKVRSVRDQRDYILRENDIISRDLRVIIGSSFSERQSNRNLAVGINGIK